MNAAHFEASLECIVEHMGDPVHAIYAALFARQPELEALFVLDTDGAVRAEMLARVFENLEALVNEAGYAEQLLQSEYINHCAMGIPDGGFTLLMDVLIDTFRTALGEHWTTDFDAVWHALRSRIADIEAAAGV